jgi:DNA-binding response OmpR family regulator
MSTSAFHILVIDDEEAVLQLLQSILRGAKYEVVACSTADEGLRHLQQGGFDCVITDAVMPGMSGYELVRTARSGRPDTRDLPILMLTRKRNREDVKRAMQAGVTDYIIKPIDESLLFEKIELYLKRGPASGATASEATFRVRADAELLLSARITSLSESEVLVNFPMALPAATKLRLASRLFQEIGVPPPPCKVLRCEENAEHGFDLKLAWSGVQEDDLAKIRAWIVERSQDG